MANIMRQFPLSMCNVSGLSGLGRPVNDANQVRSAGHEYSLVEGTLHPAHRLISKLTGAAWGIKISLVELANTTA